MLRVSPQALRRWAESVLLARPTGNPDEFAIPECPYCGDAKQCRRRLNIAKGVFHCYDDGCSASAINLVRKVHGCSRFDALRILLDYGARFEFGDRSAYAAGSTMPERLRAALSRSRPADARGAATFWLPEGFREDWRGADGILARRYAEKRGIPDWFLDSGRCGVAPETWPRRLVFLVHEAGVPVYALARSVGKAEPKYLYPPTRDGRGKSSFVYGLDLWNQGSSLVVCEGIISAVSAGEGGVAILGQDLSATQAAKIALAKPAGAIFLLEREADPERVYRGAAALQAKGVPTLVAPLSGGDPNEDPEGVPAAVAAARPPSLSNLVSAALSRRPRGRVKT